MATTIQARVSQSLRFCRWPVLYNLFVILSGEPATELPSTSSGSAYRVGPTPPTHYQLPTHLESWRKHGYQTCQDRR